MTDLELLMGTASPQERAALEVILSRVPRDRLSQFSLDQRYLGDAASNPYFGAIDRGMGSETAGSGNGAGWLDWGSVPGAPGMTGSGQDDIAGSLSSPDYSSWLRQRGYRLYDQPLWGGDWGTGQALRGIMDSSGNWVGSPQVVDMSRDEGFTYAGIAATALAGGAAAGYGGGAEAGAAGGTASGTAGTTAGTTTGTTAAGTTAGTTAGTAAGAGGGSMSWFDWANLAANLYGNYAQDRGARDAAAGQREAAREATALAGRIFDTTNEQQAPYRAAGYAALGDMMGLRDFDPTPSAEEVMNEPGYQFGLTQGMRGIENSAAARGMGLSGQALRNASRFNSDYAGTRFNDAWNRRQAAFGNRWGRLAALAGIGQSANQLTSSAGERYADRAGNNMIGAANASGAAAITRGNIWANAANRGVSAYGRMGWGQGSNGGGYSGQPGWSDNPSGDPYYMGD